MPQQKESFDAAPQVLREIPRWLLWKLLPPLKPGGKPRKVPFQPNGINASSTEPANWSSYDAVIAAYDPKVHAGIGFVFDGSDGLTGIDLDDCFDECGEENDLAQTFLSLPGYKEYSPSGNGIHIITRSEYINSPGTNHKIGLEVYTNGRYFTFTGKQIGDSAIPDTPIEFDGLIDRYLSKGTAKFAKTAPDENAFASWKATISDWPLDRVKAEILSKLDPSMGEPEWFKVGAALHHQGQGEVEWLEAFDEWSSKGANYTGYEACAQRWQRYNLTRFSGQVITLASFIGKQEKEAFKEQTAKDISKIKVVDLNDLENQHIIPIEFVIPNWMPRGVVTLFAGNGGTGKSFISLEASIRMALGLPVFGDYVPAQREKVMFISAEDGENILKWRTKDYLRFLGETSKDLEDHLILMDWTDLINPALFANSNRSEGSFTEMFKQLTALVEQHAATVLILDNSSILYAGEEQTRSMVQTFIGGLKTMYQGLAVMLMHHVNRGTVSGTDSQTYSGSTGWHNGVRARWSLTEVNGARKLKLEKNNYGKSGMEVMVSWVDAGKCFDWGTPMESNASAVSEKDLILAIVDELYREGKFLSPNTKSNGDMNAKKAIAGHPDFPSNINQKTIVEALGQLKAQELICEEEFVNKHRKTIWRIALTQAGKNYLKGEETDE